ncbi:transmembrane protease serine 9-like [Achroia grisella]|uniref:transmembrane protease serine 9-like n=1 Tax=Achroia grisella TaxID=688607 RepID=UPI0027D2CBAD|nr:transmembrane protease serine 9-like [Achroia grisella]
MKTLLVVFIIYLNNAICDNDFLKPTKLVKRYPKKVITDVRQNIHILHSKNIIKPQPAVFQLNPKRKRTKYNSYTAFPIASLDQKGVDIPDSPYFPFNENVEIKPRVKKVLPSTILNISRKKRSAPVKNKLSIKSNDAKVAKRKIKDKNVSSGNNHESTIDTETSKNSKHRAVKDVNKPKKDRTIPTHSNATIVKGRKIKNVANKNNSKVKNNTAFKKSKPKQHNKHGRKKSKKIKSKFHSIKNTKNATRHPIKPKYTVREPFSESKGKDRNIHNKDTVFSHVKPPGHHKNKVKRSRRLVAARDALIEEYPYVVSIQKGGEHWCAGALLNPRLVITTANCIWKSSRVSRLRVRAGSRKAEEGGQVAKIQEVMKHPKWSIRHNPDNDVALILLDRNIRFSDAVHAVDLPNRLMLPAFEDVWITSWGSERRDGIYDKKGMTLQVYHARLMDRDKCNNVTQRFGITVTENFICLSQTGRRAPCTRDTGAPAVSDGVVWGLASWGIRKLCGTERYPAVFSYLASQTNMDFILNATRLLMAEERFYPFLDRFPTVRATSSSTTTTLFPY